jgi:hypothetical protein
LPSGPHSRTTLHPSNPTSKPAPFTHPGQPAGRESQVAQDAPQTSPAASNAQQETNTETPSVSASKTAVPTNPAGKQDSEPPAESNAARTNPSGLQQSPEQDKERHNEKTGSDQDDRCLSFRAPGSNQDDSCLSPFRELPPGNLLARHKPARLADIHGQSAVVRSLAAFAAAPHSNAFIIAGSSGVGKPKLVASYGSKKVAEFAVSKSGKQNRG